MKKEIVEEEVPLTEEQVEDIKNLNEALSKGQSDFRLHLREIAKRKGGFPALSKKTGLPKESLYKMLNGEGHTRIGNIFKIMRALGYNFKLVKKIEPEQ